MTHAALLRSHARAILARLRLLGFASVALPIDDTTTAGPEEAPRCVFSEVDSVEVGGLRLRVAGVVTMRRRGRRYWLVRLAVTPPARRTTRPAPRRASAAC